MWSSVLACDGRGRERASRSWMFRFMIRDYERGGRVQERMCAVSMEERARGGDVVGFVERSGVFAGTRLET